MISRAVYEACDGLDGLQDGLLSDPRTCAFDPESLLCADEQQTDCLDREQVEVLKANTDEEGNILWTRQVCPFPMQAVYNGRVDINDASNFECVVN